MKPIHICPNPFANKVKCNECKAWIDKTDASTVKSFGLFGETADYYCPVHKKPYARYILAYPNNIYFAEIEVDEDGVPVGYKKVNHK